MPNHLIRRLRTAGRGLLAVLADPLVVDDRFVDLQQATREHRRKHRCGAYTYGDAGLPATLVAAVGARRVIEVGTALGYTAASMAAAVDPAAEGVVVDTVEMDSSHVDLARRLLDEAGMDGRVCVHHGNAEEVLPALGDGEFDLAFFDGFTPTLEVVELLHDRLRTGGLLVAGNLILRPKPEVTAYLTDTRVWRTHSLGETALCVRVD